jgi:hypothetical protein
MVRASIFGAIFLVSLGFAYWVSTRISYVVDLLSFLFGLGVAALTGWAWMQIGNWWTTVHRPFEPMRVVLRTEQTPAQVNLAMVWAIVQGILALTGVVVAIILILSNW